MNLLSTKQLWVLETFTEPEKKVGTTLDWKFGEDYYAGGEELLIKLDFLSEGVL